MELDQIFQWDSSALPAILGITAVTLAFIAYYFVMISPKIERKLRENRSEEEGQARWVIFQRIWGGTILGLAALLTPVLGLGKSPFEYGMSPILSGEAALIVAALGALIVLINAFRAGKPANLIQYPQIRSSKWDGMLLFKSSIGWIIYLLGYELMFRGFFLFACIETMGIWPAIAINTAIYSFAHFFKGIGETIGAIPFGLIVCVLTLYTGNFMVAFLVHCFLALSNQTIAMMAHKGMEWKKG